MDSENAARWTRPSGVPRPAKAGAADFAKRERVGRTSAPRREPIVEGPRCTTFCRAGFAGRGMTFASSSERHTLASDPDPRRSLGSAG